jgi:hypothetical protein
VSLYTEIPYNTTASAFHDLCPKLIVWITTAEVKVLIFLWIFEEIVSFAHDILGGALTIVMAGS